MARELLAHGDVSAAERGRLDGGARVRAIPEVDETARGEAGALLVGVMVHDGDQRREKGEPLVVVLVPEERRQVHLEEFAPRQAERIAQVELGAFDAQLVRLGIARIVDELERVAPDGRPPRVLTGRRRIERDVLDRWRGLVQPATQERRQVLELVLAQQRDGVRAKIGSSGGIGMRSPRAPL